MTINHKNLLQGRYEAERLPADFSPERIVPDFAFNILHPLGLLYRPVVDEDFLNNGGQKPVWPDGKPFAVCLTHDVDAVSLYSLKQSMRARRLQFEKEHLTRKRVKFLLGFGANLAASLKRSWERDPLHCYERWLEAEKEVSAHSTFFFWPGWSSIGKRHTTDCSYELFDSVEFESQEVSAGEMIQEIDRRGWEVGLHPSWYSFNSLEELKRQKNALENVVHHELVSVRQHCLHYDIRNTPRIHAAAGFKYDSTLGFNDNVGFRFGTCYPWFLYDLKTEEQLPIMEIPLIVQDGAMLNPNKGLRLDEDNAFEYVMRVARTVEKVGGVLTLLWHTNHIIDQAWWNLYMRILKYLKHKDVWFASVREIGEWWKCPK